MQNRLTATLCVCCVCLCVSVVAFKPLFTVCRCLIYGESLGKITHTPRCRWQCNRTHNKYLCRRFLFCVLCNYTRTHTVATLTTHLAHTHPHTHTTICTHYSSYFLLPEHLRLLLGKHVSHIYISLYTLRMVRLCVCVSVCALFLQTNEFARGTILSPSTPASPLLVGHFKYLQVKLFYLPCAS